MKANEKGFSAVEAVIVLVVLALLGGASFFVYKNSSKDDAKSSSRSSKSETANSQTQASQEDYVVPQDYVAYENKEIGFKFYYPQEWGKLQAKSDPKLLLSAEAPDTDTTNSSDTLRLFADKADTFTLGAVYHGATVKPVKASQGYSWQVVEPNTQFETLQPGDTYKPEPKVVFEKSDLKVYEFPNGHANAIWTTFVFSIKDKFVAVITPIEAPSIDLPQAEYDAAIAEYKAVLVKVAHSIRAL